MLNGSRRGEKGQGLEHPRLSSPLPPSLCARSSIVASPGVPVLWPSLGRTCGEGSNRDPKARCGFRTSHRVGHERGR